MTRPDPQPPRADPKPRPMSRTEKAVGYATGKALLWLGKRAIDRRDWHEANHCLAALATGASDHKAPCTLPTDRPITTRPVAVWEPYPTGESR